MVVAIVTAATLDIAVEQVYAFICVKPRIDYLTRCCFAWRNLTKHQNKLKENQQQQNKTKQNKQNKETIVNKRNIYKQRGDCH